MKRLIALCSILLSIYIFGLVYAQQNANAPVTASQELPTAEDTQTQTVWFPFNGQWLPDQDASLIGAKNFKTLQNLRYNDAAIEGVNGYSKINTTALTSYPKIRNGIQLTTDRTNTSYVIVQSQDGSGTGEIYYNTTTIPSQGDFSGTTVHQDTSGYDLPRFSPAPNGNIAYCNSKESMIWAGDEMRVAGFFTVTSSVLAGPIDYTEIINDTLQTTGHYVTLAQASTPYFVVFSTRPLSGVKFYVKSANASTATLTATHWNGTSFAAVSNASDGTSSGGKTLAQTGTVTFDSTVSTAKPYYFQGLYLYAYRFALSAGSAEVYHISTKAPFQNIVDVWDGVFRQPTQFQLYHNSSYEDYTLEVNESSYPSVPIGADLAAMTTSDHFIVIFDERQSAVKFDILAGLGNKNVSGVTVEYWTGAAYSSLTVTDETKSGTTTFAQSGVISWTPPAATAEHTQTLFGITGYAYKFTVSATLSGTHGSDELIIDQVMGIPAQNTVKPFKFSSVYKNRLMLGAYVEGKEGNRVDFSASNAPDVWNGEDSSRDGLYSLYFGGREPLTAGTQLYNRFGSNIFSTWVAFKETETYLLTGDSKDDFKIYPISYNLGCPAPLTVATAELGFETTQEAQRNVVIWLSNRGPMMFDGAVFVPIKGIDKYFDPVNTVCINSAYFKNARGWYDPNYKEYNLLIPSGDAQVTNNLWLVYDLQRKKWFEKDTGAAEIPQAAWQVMDTNGRKYVYAGIDTGYMVRLENSYRWDTTSITQTVETGDFYPTQSPWEITRLRRIKLAAKVTSEDSDVTVTHYSDATDSSGVTVALVALDTGTGARVFRDTQPINSVAWTHRLKFEATTTATLRGFSPTLWGMEYLIQRVDKTTVNPFTETPTITQTSDSRSIYYVNYQSTDQGLDDDDSSLKDLCNSVIGTGKRATVVFKHWRLSGTDNTTYTTSTTIDLSSYPNINFEFEKGAVLAVDSGVTVTLFSPSNLISVAPTQQIFSISGTGVVNFSSGGVVYPDWWGENSSPGSTDMEAEIEAADTSLGSNKGTITFVTGEYATEGAVTFDSSIYLDFKSNGKISPASGVTVTIETPSHITAPNNIQIFGGSGVIEFTSYGGGIFPAWWGCAGDGSTDDATAFQAMLTAKPDGFTPIDLLGHTYRIDSALTLPDKIKIFNGKIDFSNAGVADLFTCTGTLETALTITSDVNVGDNTISVSAPDAATLSNDDYIWLESSAYHSAYYSATQGEHHRVKSVSGTTVTLYDTTICEYKTADSAKITKINFKENIEFDNFEAVGDGTSLQQVAWFKYCRDVNIHRCKTTRFFYTHWRFLTSIKWQVKNCSVSFTRPTDNGYGVCASEGCQFFHIDENYFEHCREGIEAGAGTRGVNRYWTANFNEIVGSHAAGISTHSSAEFFEIRGNRISAKIGAAADSNGILVRAINGIVDGNQISHPNIWGIYWLPMISDLTDTRRGYITCTNNTIDFPRGKGIYIYQTTDIRINPVLVQGNTIYYASGGVGIHIRNDTGTMRNFIISNNSVNALSGAYDVCRVESTGGSIQIGTITGNAFFRADDLAFNIYLIGNVTLGLNYVSVTGNSLYNGSVGVKGSNSDYVNVTGNTIMGCGDHFDGFGVNSVENHNIGS